MDSLFLQFLEEIDNLMNDLRSGYSNRGMIGATNGEMRINEWEEQKRQEANEKNSMRILARNESKTEYWQWR